MRSIVVLISLDETEATGSPLELVQAHDHPLHLAALAEELVDLLLRGVEAHVANIESGSLSQQTLLLSTRPLQEKQSKRNIVLILGPRHGVTLKCWSR